MSRSPRSDVWSSVAPRSKPSPLWPPCCRGGPSSPERSPTGWTPRESPSARWRWRRPIPRALLARAAAAEALHRFPAARADLAAAERGGGREREIATAERHGVKLGVVVLNSDAPGTQAKQLLDRGFEHVYHQQRVAEPPIPPGG